MAADSLTEVVAGALRDVKAAGWACMGVRNSGGESQRVVTRSCLLFSGCKSIFARASPCARHAAAHLTIRETTPSSYRACPSIHPLPPLGNSPSLTSKLHLGPMITMKASSYFCFNIYMGHSTYIASDVTMRRDPTVENFDSEDLVQLAWQQLPRF